jgi:Acetyltransferases
MEDIKIVDYEEKYAEEIDKIESIEWQTDGIVNVLDENSIALVAKKEEEVIGTIYGNEVGDLFILDVLIIKKEYQNKGIGTALMTEMFNKIKNKNIKNILAKVVFSNNHMNAEGLIKKFNFKETLRIKGYWGSKYPDISCKVCNCMPCECTCVFYIKEINDLIENKER